LEFKVSFQHKYGYIRDKRSRLESYPYPVKEGQQGNRNRQTGTKNTYFFVNSPQ